MNKRFIGVLIFAFIVAAGGGVITYRSLINRGPSQAQAPPTTRVVLASRDLEVGAILTDSDVTLADWSGPIPAGASTRTQDVVGRGVITPIYSKEPLIDSRLAAKGAGGGLASMIPPGMRAFAVRVNDVVGVAGFVTPGKRVDVVINGTPPGGDNSQGTQARTLLQNIEVLSAGQEIKKDTEGKPVQTQVVNLVVTPEQAEQLSLAANGTQIQLVLRNPLDQATAKVPGTALAALFAGGPPKPPVPRVASAPAPRPVVREIATPVKKEAPFTMQIISGTKSSETKFDNRAEGK